MPIGSFSCKSKSFSEERFQTRLETEAQGNSKMAYGTKMLPNVSITSNWNQITGNKLVPAKAADNSQNTSLREILLSEYAKSQA